MITGAQALVDGLRREGIDHVFGIPGTMNLPTLDVLRATPEIRFVLTRHEQGAAFMAYGYARALNRAAVVTATEGPGVTNLATGIGAAYKGYVPIVSGGGAQELWVREKDASQDIDQVTFHRPITKWAYSIPAASKVQEAIRRAFRVALAEPQGPVHLDCSRDILLEHCESEPIAPAPLGRNGWSSANRAVPEADVVVALGAHIDLFSTTFKYGIISRDAKLIHHSTVATDIGVVFPVAQAVVGSTASFIDGLRERLHGKWEWTSVAKPRRDWDEEREHLLDYKP